MSSTVERSWRALEEVAQQLVALVGEHRLGMELHALGRQLAMAQPHQHAAATRGLLQTVGQLRVDDERVIAADRQRRGQAAEDRAPVVLDAGRLAVHGWVQLPAPAERLRERLVTKAHP